MSSKFTADFETTTNPNDCRVWAWAVSEIGEPDNFQYGNDIDSFMEFCENSKNSKFWFHNLKFDGSFIISWLLNNGFEYIEDKKDRDAGTFTTLITDMGQFYSIEVWWRVSEHKVKKVTFYDSLKILNFSVEQIAKDFDLPIRKLKIDYSAYRAIGHQLTPDEVDYIRNDVEIMSRALNIIFDMGLNKMTIGSDSLAKYKEINPYFNRYFPQLNPEIDKEVRESYKGGFTYVNPKYKEKEVGHGVVFDVNSLYPYVLSTCEQAYGLPEPFIGEYKEDITFPLYVINFSCIFELKEGKIPSLQIKNSPVFIPNEYLESSHNEVVNLTLTSVDFELFKEQYDYEIIEYFGGWKFKSMEGLFSQYIEQCMEGKIKAKKEGKSSQYLTYKLLANSIYGKFGTGIYGAKKHPYLDDKGVLRFKMGITEEKKGVYIPVASFTTSYARAQTIRTSQAIRDWSINKYGEDLYLYSDTDSIHMRVINEDEDIKELSKIINIDDYELGAWKLESRFKRGAYIRQKCYIEQDYEGAIHTTIAGFPKQLQPLITFENFKIGFTTEGISTKEMAELARKNGASEEQIEKLHPKLGYKYVKGGVILEDVDFTIKA